MTPIQRLAHNLHMALMVLVPDDTDDGCPDIWAWFGSERVYQYSTVTGNEIDSFYNGAWSNDKPTEQAVRKFTREHIESLTEQEA